MSQFPTNPYDEIQQLKQEKNDLLSPLYAAPYIKEGWQMVPEDPTPEMIVAAKNLDWGNSDVEGSCINQWQVMLSAAPEYGK